MEELNKIITYRYECIKNSNIYERELNLFDFHAVPSGTCLFVAVLVYARTRANPSGLGTLHMVEH
ncbi:MAG: hypothetical protein AUJ99_00890 [Caldisericum sp. CG2_30_36_11]|nr:hypothetical protein [Caldisericota bacterium]OIP13806.1 MAG: hypothetical protein AUJ99_00890 [Caldisericum sp. CG2_30_36_11]